MDEKREDAIVEEEKEGDETVTEEEEEKKEKEVGGGGGGRGEGADLFLAYTWINDSIIVRKLKDDQGSELVKGAT